MPLTSLLSAIAQEQQVSGGGYREFIDSAARTPLSEVVYIVAALTVLRLAISPYLRNTPAHKRTATYGLARFFNEVLDAVIYAGVFVFMVIRPFAIQAFLIPSGSMWPTLYVNDFIVANKAIYRYTDPKVNDIVVFRPPVDATFMNPEQRDKNGNVKVDFIKRCVGAPGDVVEIRQGAMYRNGKLAQDPNKHYSVRIDDSNYAEMPADQIPQTASANASFKFIKWHNKIIPLNYTTTEANAGVTGYDNAYEVAPQYVISSHEDQMQAIKQPAQPVPPGFYFMMGDNRNNSFDGRGWGLVPRDSIIGRAEFIWLPFNRIGRTK
ncbi:MAG TPA: signal peptidase I [Fimbriimonas sp.]|nr:signal peptidase I [Fimbriimonas sp.]